MDGIIFKILKPIQFEEICLPDTATVAEAEQRLTDCFIDGVSVDIYVNRGYHMTKDTPLGEGDYGQSV